MSTPLSDRAFHGDPHTGLHPEIKNWGDAHKFAQKLESDRALLLDTLISEYKANVTELERLTELLKSDFNNWWRYEKTVERLQESVSRSMLVIAMVDSGVQFTLHVLHDVATNTTESVDHDLHPAPAEFSRALRRKLFDK